MCIKMFLSVPSLGRPLARREFRFSFIFIFGKKTRLIKKKKKKKKKIQKKTLYFLMFSRELRVLNTLHTYVYILYNNSVHAVGVGSLFDE
jgi:hypothetical protein